MDWIVRPIRAVLFADEQAFLWIRRKLGLTEYGMAPWHHRSLVDLSSAGQGSFTRVGGFYLGF